MRKSIFALGVMFGLMLPLQQAAAHGGGLNSAGCHNETATGGYHCHNKKKDDVNWGVIGAVAGGGGGGGLVLWLLVDWLDDDETALASKFQLVPHFSQDEAGIVVEYSLDGLHRIRLSHPDTHGRPRGYLSWYPLAAALLISSG